MVIFQRYWNISKYIKKKELAQRSLRTQRKKDWTGLTRLKLIKNKRYYHEEIRTRAESAENAEEKRLNYLL